MTIIKPETSSHWYTATGEPAYGATLREARKQNLLPSVTSILKAWPAPQLEMWKQEQLILAALTMPDLERAKYPDLNSLARGIVESSKEEAKKAADWGSTMHDYADQWACGSLELDQVAAPWLLHVDAFVKWAKRTVSEVKRCESVVTNLSQGYAGRIDAVVITQQNQLVLWDIKCRSVKNGKAPIYDTMPMQLAAYSLCLANEGIRPNEWWSLTINRDTPEPPYLRSWTPEEQASAFENWNLCRTLWTRTLGRGYGFDPNKPQETKE